MSIHSQLFQFFPSAFFVYASNCYSRLLGNWTFLHLRFEICNFQPLQFYSWSRVSSHFDFPLHKCLKPKWLTQYSISLPPENLFWHFQGVQKWNIRLKWVYHSNNELNKPTKRLNNIALGLCSSDLLVYFGPVCTF